MYGVIQGDGNHGGEVRACSRLLHVPARQIWQRKAGKSPPLQLKTEQIKPRSAVRSEGLTRLDPGMVQDWEGDDEDDRV